MARQKNIIDFSKLLLSFMAQPDPFFSMMQRVPILTP